MRTFTIAAAVLFVFAMGSYALPIAGMHDLVSIEERVPDIEAPGVATDEPIDGELRGYKLKSRGIETTDEPIDGELRGYKLKFREIESTDKAVLDGELRGYKLKSRGIEVSGVTADGPVLEGELRGY